MKFTHWPWPKLLGGPAATDAFLVTYKHRKQWNLQHKEKFKIGLDLNCFCKSDTQMKVWVTSYPWFKRVLALPHQLLHTFPDFWRDFPSIESLDFLLYSSLGQETVGQKIKIHDFLWWHFIPTAPIILGECHALCISFDGLYWAARTWGKQKYQNENCMYTIGFEPTTSDQSNRMCSPWTKELYGDHLKVKFKHACQFNKSYWSQQSVLWHVNSQIISTLILSNCKKHAAVVCRKSTNLGDWSYFFMLTNDVLKFPIRCSTPSSISLMTSNRAQW